MKNKKNKELAVCGFEAVKALEKNNFEILMESINVLFELIGKLKNINIKEFENINSKNFDLDQIYSLFLDIPRQLNEKDIYLMDNFMIELKKSIKELHKNKNNYDKNIIEPLFDKIYSNFISSFYNFIYSLH